MAPFAKLFNKNVSGIGPPIHALQTFVKVQAGTIMGSIDVEYDLDDSLELYIVDYYGKIGPHFVVKGPITLPAEPMRQVVGANGVNKIKRFNKTAKPFIITCEVYVIVFQNVIDVSVYEIFGQHPAAEIEAQGSTGTKPMSKEPNITIQGPSIRSCRRVATPKGQRQTVINQRRIAKPKTQEPTRRSQRNVAKQEAQDLTRGALEGWPRKQFKIEGTTFQDRHDRSTDQTD